MGIPECFWGCAFESGEEAGEGGLSGEIESFRNFLDAETGVLEQPRCLHEEHPVDVIDHGSSCDLPHDA